MAMGMAYVDLPCRQNVKPEAALAVILALVRTIGKHQKVLCPMAREPPAAAIEHNCRCSVVISLSRVDAAGETMPRRSGGCWALPSPLRRQFRER